MFTEFEPCCWWCRLMCFLHGHLIVENEVRYLGVYCRRCRFNR